MCTMMVVTTYTRSFGLIQLKQILINEQMEGGNEDIKHSDFA